MKLALMRTTVAGAWLYFWIALTQALFGLSPSLPESVFAGLERDLVASASCLLFLSGAILLRHLALTQLWKLPTRFYNSVPALALVLAIFVFSRSHTIGTVLLLFVLSLLFNGDGSPKRVLNFGSQPTSNLVAAMYGAALPWFYFLSRAMPVEDNQRLFNASIVLSVVIFGLVYFLGRRAGRKQSDDGTVKRGSSGE